MDIVVNGSPREAPPGATLLQLLASMGLDPGTVVVERNGAIVDRGTYAAVPLAEADRLEIVRFVGGG